MGMNATTRPRSLYDEAMEAVSAGISIVPPSEDGSKRPITAWTMFQKNIPPLGRVRRWYADGRYSGIGVVCGAVSGNLECLDFDDAHAFALWRDTGESMNLGDLIGRVLAGYSEQTPSGGVHILYRCPEIGGNQKLARSPEKSLIETRGEGGFVVTAPSHGAVHASGRPYERLSGAFASIVTISPQERAELHRLARALDQMPDEHPLPPIGTTKADGDGDRPGDLYIARTTWHDILPQHGWTAVRTSGDTTYWRRPGKTEGISATTNRHGNDLLWMFTSSTEFQPNRSYTRFGAFAVLEHGGDFKAATKDLVRLGYRPEPPPASTFTSGAKQSKEYSEGHSENGQPPQTGAADAERTRQAPRLPRLDAGCQDLALMTGLAWEAVARRNDPPRMFTYAGEPIRLDPDEHDDPAPRPLTPERLRHEAARAAEWYTVKKVKDEWVESPGKPNKDLVTDMLASPAVPLPSLGRIVASPVFANNGALQTNQGYHPASRTYYHAAAGFTLPDVPDRPTSADVAEARRWILDELLVDFPFVSDADRAHAVAELLLTPARAMIPGAAPLHVHEAPTQGTGKDLLAEAMGIVVLGREPHTMSYGREPEEFEKRLVATLRTMPEWVVLPNVRGEVTNDALADAISRGMFTGRILGLSDMARLPARNVWTLTANNAELSADFTRRSIRIRLDAQMERPQARVDFKHPQLKPWARQNRARLVWATLTLVRAWVTAGRPAHAGPSIGGFEDWAEVIGGVLAHAGIDGFLGNLDEFYQAADGEAITRRAFVAAWWEKFQRDAVGTASLFPIATADEVEMDLGDRGEQSQKSRLGHVLKTMRDRRYTLANGYTVKVTFSGTGANANRYALQLVDRGGAENDL